MPDDDRKIDIRHFVLLKNRGLRGCNGLGSARVSRAGDGVVAIANVRKRGPDWARTSYPAIIKRMLEPTELQAHKNVDFVSGTAESNRPGYLNLECTND